MTIADAIAAYRERFPNDPYPDRRLREQLTALDNMAQIELLAGNEVISYGEDDSDKALLLSGTAFEDIYILYLTSMSFFDRQDWLNYSNAKIMFNARYLEAQNYYARKGPPPVGTKITNLW